MLGEGKEIGMFWVIPGGSVSDHGIEHGEQFTHGSDQGHLTGLAGCDQLLIEGLDRRVVDSGAHGGHVEGASDVGPSAPLEPLPLTTTVPVQGSEPTAICLRFREPGESADDEGGNGAHAGDISEEEELVLPEDVENLAVDIQFLREELDVFVLGEEGRGRA